MGEKVGGTINSKNYFIILMLSPYIVSIVLLVGVQFVEQYPFQTGLLVSIPLVLMVGICILGLVNEKLVEHDTKLTVIGAVVLVVGIGISIYAGYVFIVDYYDAMMPLIDEAMNN